MGIYSDGTIFGIAIYKLDFNMDFGVNILFEKKYDNIMDENQLKEACTFYNNLNNKNNIRINIYTRCYTTLDNSPDYSMMWFPSDIDTLLQKINNIAP